MLEKIGDRPVAKGVWGEGKKKNERMKFKN